MSIEIHRIARLRMDTETTFASDLTASLGGFVDVPAIEGSVTLVVTTDVLNPEYLQQHIDERAEGILGRKSARLTFAMNLASTGTAAASGVTAVQGALGEILKAVMGGEDLGVGSTINDAGVAATDFDVTTATGFTAGTAIGVVAGGVTQWRVIEVVTGFNLTPKLAFSTAPANGAVVNSCASYYLTQNPTGTLQFVLQGAEGNDGWVTLGCQLESMAIDVTSAALPRITFTFLCANWLHGSDAAGAANLDNYTIAAATYSNVSPTVAVDGQYTQQTVNTQTYNATTSRPSVSSETWACSIRYAPVTSPSGTQTIAQFRRERTAPVITGTFRVPYEGETWFDVRTDREDKAFVRQIGTAAGGTVLLEAATAQVVDVQRVDEGGLAYVEVSWEGRNDTETGGTPDQEESAFRIHLG